MCISFLKLGEDEASDRKQFFKWVMEMQRRNESTAELLGHQREDMVVDCYINGDPCNSARQLQLEMYGRYGNCYCVGCNRSSAPYRFHLVNNVAEGLQLLLNVEPEEYLPLSVEAGFVVNVHQAGVDVDFRKDGVFVPPRHTTFISVTQGTHKRLTPPFRNPCQKTWPDEYLQYAPKGKIYTQGACKDICAQLLVLQACKCQSHDYIILDRGLAEICSEDDEELNACIGDVAAKITNKEVLCPCLPSCNTVTYTRKASSLRWAKYIGSTPSASADGKVLAKVFVYFATTQRELRRHDPKITWNLLVSNLGSTIGMYVGMSFLHMFHVGDIIVRAVVNAYKVKTRRKRAK